MPPTDGPLAGLTVLDFTTLLPGPLATLTLAEAGARVIKIERPEGEDMRRMPPYFGSGGETMSAPFALLNRGKESLKLDLKDPAAAGEIRRIAATADVLVEQFRPGVMDRLGLGYAALRDVNPRLVYCAITGYGQEGPRASEAGHDLNYQSVTGLLALSHGELERPTVPAALVADIGGGTMTAVMNILLALLRRERTGQGAFLDIAMADAMFTFGVFAAASLGAGSGVPSSGRGMLTGGLPRYALYATADDRLIAVGALEEKFWQAFCEAIGLDPAFRDDRATPEATHGAVADRIRSRTAAEWRGPLAAADCCATIVATFAEAVADPHFVARGLFDRTVTTPSGRLPAAVVPLAPVFRGDPAAKPAPE